MGCPAGLRPGRSETDLRVGSPKVRGSTVSRAPSAFLGHNQPWRPTLSMQPPMQCVRRPLVTSEFATAEARNRPKLMIPPPPFAQVRGPFRSTERASSGSRTRPVNGLSTNHRAVASKTGPAAGGRPVFGFFARSQPCQRALVELAKPSLLREAECGCGRSEAIDVCLDGVEPEAHGDDGEVRSAGGGPGVDLGGEFTDVLVEGDVLGAEAVD
jgi:hypothetical protein